ncbi:MAG: hypothetical protein FWF78_01825 [Defluviitaleaceae bacterium]|nr:hypothetical protein [Defluviitaleaceae bacterium]
MTRDLIAIREKGINALTKELGSSGMAVFMSQFENGSGNYTEEREELLKDLTIDDIVTSIKKRKNSNAI